MTTTLLLSFLPYMVIMNYTPGPANIFSLSTSSRYGFHTFLKVLSGLFTGFMCDMLFAIVFTLGFSSLLPSAEKMLTYVGAFYILWLAWHIFKTPVNVTVNQTNDEFPQHMKIISDSPDSSKELSGYFHRKREKKSPSFWVGFFLQLSNVKVILYGITVYSVYLIPLFSKSSQLPKLHQLLLCIPLLAIVGASSCILWALLGSVLQNILNKHARVSNTVMALMLLGCVGEILFP